MKTKILGGFALAFCCAAPGCGGGDDDELTSEFGTFIASCDLRSVNQCFNWYGEDVPDEDLARFTEQVCGEGYRSPCPSEGAIGMCTDPTGGYGIPGQLTAVDVWYAPMTASDAQMNCERGGGSWSPSYSP